MGHLYQNAPSEGFIMGHIKAQWSPTGTFWVGWAVVIRIGKAGTDTEMLKDLCFRQDGPGNQTWAFRLRKIWRTSRNCWGMGDQVWGPLAERRRGLSEPWLAVLSKQGTAGRHQAFGKQTGKWRQHTRKTFWTPDGKMQETIACCISSVS